MGPSGRPSGFIECYALGKPPRSFWWNWVGLTTQLDRDRTAQKLRASQGGYDAKSQVWLAEVDWIYQDCAKRFMATPEPLDLADEEDEPELQLLFDPIA